MALVGYGLGGSVFHAPLIAATPGLSLEAVVTSDPGRQEQARRRYPGVRIAPSVEGLLGTDPLDLIVVSVPNAYHFKVAEVALRAGIPTVVDKPVAPTSAQAARLAGTARKSGATLIPYHNRRWDGDFLTVADLLESRRLGRIYRFESRFERWKQPGSADKRSWKDDPSLPGGGILFDLGSHLVDQALTLFGSPASVYSEMVARAGQLDDDVFLAMQYPGDLMVHLWASNKAARLGPRFRVLGSRAAYVKYGMDPQEEALRAGRQPYEPRWGEESAEAWGELGAGDTTRLVPTRAGCYQSFYAGVAAHLLRGAPPPVRIDDAIAGLGVLEAAVASATSRSVVEVV